MDTNLDIESFVRLKFYPPQATREYVDTIPYEVVDHFFINSFINKRETFVRMIGYLEDYCELWDMLKPRLIEYYEQNGT